MELPHLGTELYFCVGLSGRLHLGTELYFSVVLSGRPPLGMELPHLAELYFCVLPSVHTDVFTNNDSVDKINH